MKNSLCPDFSRFSQRLQHAIVHGLQWRSLRPVQELAVGPVLDGHNLLILAPTAGGKTEAAILPLLDSLLGRGQRGVGALYLSPLKALLNNQETRLTKLAGLVGLTVFKWHGDVSTQDRKHFSREPADILMLTPESLEVMLLSGRATLLFAGLRCVVIDEIHAFAGDDRGDHLVAMLERLAATAGHDLQRIGLSATVGNPDELLTWLCGQSQRPAQVVRAPHEGLRRRIEMHPLEEDETEAVVRRLVRGRKSLLFSESRSGTERLKSALDGVQTFVHHGSLSPEVREDAERAFRSGANACILCTSSMELGLDIGDLDVVLQLDSPPSVSAFLQRLGRTGRRPGTVGHMALLTDCGWGFLQATAIVSLATHGYIEPVSIRSRSYHIFVHQLFSRLLAEGGVPRPRLVEGIGGPACFSGIDTAAREAILNHLLETGVLEVLDGRVTFSAAGERQIGRHHFEMLYSVFESSQQLDVRTESDRAVGQVDAWFAQAMRPGEFVFVLGGRSWQVVSCDWTRRQVTVRPAAHGQIPTWQGVPRLLRPELCQAVRQLLIGSEPIAFLHPPAQKVLDRWREDWAPVLSCGRVVCAVDEQEVTVYTFAGGRINNVLGRALQRHAGVSVRINNYWVSYRKADVDAPLDPLYEALEAVRSFTADDLCELVRLLPPGRLSKFQPFLPPALQEALVGERLFDLPGAVAWLEEGVVTVGGQAGRCAAQYTV